MADPTSTKERKAHPVAWTTGAVFLAVLTVSILGAVPAEHPVIRNPEAIITQILVTAGVIGAATLPILIKTQRDAAVAKDQLANDHIDDAGNQINLRVEQDERHSEVVALVSERFDDLTKHFNTQFDGVRSDIRGIRTDVGRNTNRITRTSDKLDEHLEDSRKIIRRFDREIGALHRLNAQLDTGQIEVIRPTQEGEAE